MPAGRRGSSGTFRRSSLEPLLNTLGLDPDKKGVGVFGLVAVGFFWVSGGSYGNEALALSAPPGLLFFGITVVGLSYGIPLALITAELGTGWPLAGGMAAWVEVACGPVVGAHNAWWIWVSFVFDAAIYPVLASEYFSQYMNGEITWAQRKLYATGIVILMTFVKLLGRDALARISSLLALLTLTPSFIYIFSTLKFLDFDYLMSTHDPTCNISEAMCTLVNPNNTVQRVNAGCNWDGEKCQDIDYALLTSFIMWLYAGFMSLGSMAGELEDPKKSYLCAIMVLVPIVLIINCFPLMVSLSLDHNRNHFEPGHFEVLATAHVGPWMKTVYFLGSQVSLYGLYNSTAIAAECTIPPYFEKYFNILGFEVDKNPKEGDSGFLTPVHKALLEGDTENEEPAPFYVVLCGMVCGALVWLNYQLLVEVTMLLMVLMTFTFLYAFVRLRMIADDVPRAFKLPGGICGAMLVALMPAGISGWYIYTCVFLTVDTSFGIPYFNVLCLVATVAIGLVVQLLYTCGCSAKCRSSPYDKRPPVSTYGRGSHGIQAPGSMLDYGERKPSDEWNRSTWPGAEGGETENGAGAAWPSNPDAADGE